MGCVSLARSDSKFPMDDSGNPDRVDAYLAWRTVNALDRIAAFCDSILYGLMIYTFFYFAVLIVQKFGGTKE
jgi:hypothetical protein